MTIAMTMTTTTTTTTMTKTSKRKDVVANDTNKNISEITRQKKTFAIPLNDEPG